MQGKTTSCHGRVWSRALTLLVSMLIMAFAITVGGWRATQLLGTDRLQAATGASARETVTEVVVTPGDTLWRIATKYGPAGVDPRQTIAAIREHNDLRSADLQPGMVLIVPLIR